MKRNTGLNLLLMLGLIIGMIVPWVAPGWEGQVRAGAAAADALNEGTIYAVTAGNKLISFNRATPGAIINSVQLTDVQEGDDIIALDFRPRTGQLFAISQNNRIYTINPVTGAALGAALTPLSPPLVGTSFGLDFNPVVDRLRIVSDVDQNVRINPNDGTVISVDNPLVYAASDPSVSQNPNIVGSAYDGNYSGSTGTTLYGIDSALDTLVRQGSVSGNPMSPNGGELRTIGLLGIDTTDQVGFDISGPGDVAFASLTPAGGQTSSFYTIDLSTGAATKIGEIGGGEIIRGIAVVVRVETIFALSSGNKLLSFNSGNPGMADAVININGLGAGESLLGMDFRPQTGELFAVSNQSRLYSINTTTGAATAVGGVPFTPAAGGTSLGVDFNPGVDLLRLVSDSRQNLRINPKNGAVVAADTNLVFAPGDPNAGAAPNIVGSAYSNNLAGAAATTLYAIDSNLDVLVLQGSIDGSPVSPNSGQLTTVGTLGLNTTGLVGFDIAPETNAVFASLTPPGSSTSSLYTLDPASGRATLIGEIDGGETIVDIAIAVDVEIIYAVTEDNKLISFNSRTPGTIQSTAIIAGLQNNQAVVGLDFRPLNGQLLAISGDSRLYLLDPLTGFASPIGATAFSPALNGSSFGVDTDPVSDFIRVIGDAGQNLRIATDGSVNAGVDAQLTYAAGDPRAGQTPSIAGVAYDNSMAGTSSSTLYGIDFGFDSLIRLGSPGGVPLSPGTGQVFTVGSLGVDSTGVVGFDLSVLGNRAFASLFVGGVSRLYSIDLISGGATVIGQIGNGEAIRGIAVSNAPPLSAQTAGVAAVNAASFAGQNLAPDSLAAIFGRFQTDDGGFFLASSQPLPATLGGIKVSIDGNPAGLLAAGNGQINVLLPAISADGLKSVTVTNADGTVRTGTINIVRAAPGIFTALSNGQGTAAAVWTFDGQTFFPVVNPDGSERPIEPGSANNPVFLVLFVTGLRNVPASNPGDENGVAEAVSIMLQNTGATVTYAGPAPGFAGLDQINLVIPPSLAGSGTVNLNLTAGGQTANIVTVRIGP